MDVDVDKCKDKRGVRRGPCVALSCACSGYRRPDEGKEGGMKCIDCLHPPGKHKNLDNPNATDSQEIAAHSSSGVVAPSHPSQLQPNFHQIPPVVQEPCVTVQLPDLPICKRKGCSKRIHWEVYMGRLLVFDYCDPQCRDLDLLKDHQEILKITVEELKNELQDKVMHDIIRNTSSTKHVKSSSVTDGRHSSPVDRPQPSKSNKQPSSLPAPIACSSNGSISQASNDFGSIHAQSGPNITDPRGRPNAKEAGNTGDMHTKNSSSRKQSNSVSKSKVNKKQKTQDIDLRKECGESLGLILSRDPYHLSGFLITGAKIPSVAYTEMQRDKIKLFDLIQRVEHDSIDRIDIVEESVQKTFDDMIKGKRSVKITVNREMSLSASTVLKKVRTSGAPANYVVALPYFSNEHFSNGLSLQKKLDAVCITECVKNSPARCYGLKCNDNIRLLMVTSTADADQRLISDECLVSLNCSEDYCQRLKEALERAHKAEKHVLFAVQR